MEQQTPDERIANALERIAMLEAFVSGLSDSLEIAYARLLALRDVLAKKGVIRAEDVEALATSMRVSVEAAVEFSPEYEAFRRWRGEMQSGGVAPDDVEK